MNGPSLDTVFPANRVDGATGSGLKLFLTGVEPVAFTRKGPSEVWGASLTFHPNEKILVTGVSGSGKSSLLAFLYGLNVSYSGSIVYNEAEGKSFSETVWSMMRQTRLAIVFQTLKLFGDLTARENIELYSSLASDAALQAENMMEMAQRLGVAAVLDRRAAELSQGERQRIAIIRSLSRPFQWLFLDEPFSHLDEANRRSAWSIIETECRNRNAGILLADLEPLPDMYRFDRRLSL